MLSILTDTKALERKEDKEIAESFVQSLDKELKSKKEEEVIPELKKLVKDMVKDHPYLVGLLIGIIIMKYGDIAKKIDI